MLGPVFTDIRYLVLSTVLYSWQTSAQGTAGKGVGDWEPLPVTFLKVCRYFQIRLMLHPPFPSLRIRLLKSVGFVFTTVELYSLEEMFTHHISVKLYLWFAASFLEESQRSCKFVHRGRNGWRKNYVKRRNNVWMPRLQSIWSITLLC